MRVTVATRNDRSLHIEYTFVLVVFIFAISDDELPAGLLQSINLVEGMADHAFSEFAAKVLGLRVFSTRIEGLLEIAFVSDKGG